MLFFPGWRLRDFNRALEEVVRHIADEAANIEREAAELRRKREQWQRRFPRTTMAETAEVDVSGLTDAPNSSFRWTIQHDWKARIHEALKCDPGAIFERYFSRKPPFDAGKGKEFPDAFVIEVLAGWCRKSNSTMYVVTADTAMQRAAAETGLLIPVSSLQDLLGIAAEAQTPELITAVEKTKATREFLDTLQDFVEGNIGWLGTVYSGDLTEGEILETTVSKEVEILQFSIISAFEDIVGTIFSLKVPLDVTALFIDEGASWYDKESGERHYDEKEIKKFESTPTIRVYIEFDRSNMNITDMNILTTNIYLSEPFEDYK